MSTEGPATYSHRFQLCAILLPSVDKSSEGNFCKILICRVGYLSLEL